MRKRIKNHPKIVGYIFRPYITKNGVRIWARQYGHKAWRIPVYED